MKIKKEINKTETIKKIIDWANKSIGNSFNTKKFNAAMLKKNWKNDLIAFAKFCKVEIVYEEKIDCQKAISLKLCPIKYGNEGSSCETCLYKDD